MTKKTFKIGEYCRGGIITVEVDGTMVRVIGKEWDFSAGSNKGSNQSKAKEFTRLEVSSEDYNVERKLDDFISDLSTGYYTDMIMKFIKSKITLRSFGW